MTSIIPRTAPDVRPLAYALDHMTPDLTALILPGEDWDALMARRAAAQDILDELLYEYADEHGAVAA